MTYPNYGYGTPSPTPGTNEGAGYAPKENTTTVPVPRSSGLSARLYPAPRVTPVVYKPPTIKPDGYDYGSIRQKAATAKRKKS
jgi:hypothetical protein